jgi:hypothetical protein
MTAPHRSSNQLKSPLAAQGPSTDDNAPGAKFPNFVDGYIGGLRHFACWWAFALGMSDRWKGEPWQANTLTL